MASDEQIIANRFNAQKSTGAVTNEGKEAIKYNALKHGILKSDMSPYEDSDIEEIKSELFDDFKPTSKIQGYLVERVAVHLVKLKRITKAEKELFLSLLHPDFKPINLGNKGAYRSKVGVEGVKTMADIYQRYEVTEENRMYKALEQLRQLQTTT